MRRDLTRGCAACRLRFSALLTHCPVCRAPAASVAEATSQVQSTSRAAWLAKWVIVLSCIPAFGVVAGAGASLALEGWPPKNALDIVMFVLGGMGVCLGASIAVGVPLAIWFGIISALRFILKYLVDRPKRSLRISLERSPRFSDAKKDHIMHRLWKKLSSFAEKQMEAGTRLVIIGISVFVGLQILAEVFGSRPTVKISSRDDFGGSMVALAVVDVIGVMIGSLFVTAFGAVFSTAREFFAKPPNLFGYDPTPPPVQNETCMETFVQNRHETVGHAVALDEAERAALDAESASQLRGPLSSQTCFAFRLVGNADGQPVDDADATNFAIITKDESRCVVSSSDVVVSIPAETKIRAENAQGFLRERGLPERNVALREGLLRTGDLVRIVGRRTEIRVGTVGYRGDERRLMIDAGDGLPVMILAANETHS